MKIIVTGSSGFVGSNVTQYFRNFEYDVVEITRYSQPNFFDILDSCDDDHNLVSIFDGVQAVVHCAGIAHRLNIAQFSDWDEYKRINVEATLRFAELAAKNCVKRFIFISSAKVCGESTSNMRPFSEVSKPNPGSSYALSKYLAEVGLHKIAESSDMEVVIVRPPLIYGPGVRANFRSLINWISDGKPLPFAALDFNRRSFLGIDNLNDFLSCCITNPNAANQTFFVSDGCSISTAELIRKISNALGVKARLYSVPLSLLTLVAKFLSKYDQLRAISASFEVDISKSKILLGWKPPVSMNEGLKNIF
jgi:nucleoside-diphosphate-sugar epimerase